MRRCLKRVLGWLEWTPTLARPCGWLGWPVLWLAMVAVGVALGGLIGAMAYVFFGSLAGHALGVSGLARNGLLDGGFYALIWFPGGSLVAAAVLAHRRAELVSSKGLP